MGDNSAPHHAYGFIFAPIPVKPRLQQLIAEIEKPRSNDYPQTGIETLHHRRDFKGGGEVKMHEAELLSQKLRAAIMAHEDLADTHEKLGYGSLAREARAIANAYRARLITVSQLAGSTFEPADKSES